MSIGYRLRWMLRDLKTSATEDGVEWKDTVKQEFLHTAEVGLTYQVLGQAGIALKKAVGRIRIKHWENPKMLRKCLRLFSGRKKKELYSAKDLSKGNRLKIP